MSNETNEESVTYDRKDLKILALKDSIAKISEENADLRVELTIAVQQVQQLSEALEAANADKGEEVVETEKDKD